MNEQRRLYDALSNGDLKTLVTPLSEKNGRLRARVNATIYRKNPRAQVARENLVLGEAGLRTLVTLHLSNELDYARATS